MSSRKSVFDILEYICIVLLILLLGGMVVLIFGQVISRYVFNRPLSWSEELSRHLMIWSAFIGSALAYRKNAHLGVDVLINLMPKGIRKTVLTLVNAGVAGFSIFLITIGYEVAVKTMRQFSSALRIPMGYIYLSIPVGAALILLFSVEKIYKILKEKDVHEKGPIPS